MDTNTVIRKINGGKGAALNNDQSKANEEILLTQSVLNGMLLSGDDNYLQKKHKLWLQEKEKKEKFNSVMQQAVDKLESLRKNEDSEFTAQLS